MHVQCRSDSQLPNNCLDPGSLHYVVPLLSPSLLVTSIPPFLLAKTRHMAPVKWKGSLEKVFLLIDVLVSVLQRNGTINIPHTHTNTYTCTHIYRDLLWGIGSWNYGGLQVSRPESASWRPRRADSVSSSLKVSSLETEEELMFQLESKGRRRSMSQLNQPGGRSSLLLRGRSGFLFTQVFSWLGEAHSY